MQVRAQWYVYEGRVYNVFEVSFVMPGNLHFVIGPSMRGKHACSCVEQGALAFWTGAATSNRLEVEAENESNKTCVPVTSNTEFHFKIHFLRNLSMTCRPNFESVGCLTPVP